MLNLNDIPWGLIWFAGLLILWIIQGVSRLGKAAQRQAAVAQGQAAQSEAAAKARTRAAADASTIVELQPSRTIVRPLVMTPRATPIVTQPPPVPPPSAIRTHQRRERHERRPVVAAAYAGPAAAPLATLAIAGEPPVHRPALLAPFAHRNRLLAAIVVSEALRPPIGLRPHEQR